jgi:hypothetical protein
MDLAPLADFHVALAGDDTELAAIDHLSLAEIAQRRRAGHLPYLAYLGDYRRVLLMIAVTPNIHGDNLKHSEYPHW